MYILAANWTWEFSKPSKTVYKSYLSYKIVLVAKRIYFRVRKVKWVTKKYMLVGDVEVLYEHPLRTLSNQLFSIDFYALSDGACCQKKITGNIVKKAIFNMAALKKCRKIKNGNFRKF